MNVLVIEHADNEGPGLIEYSLRQNKIPFRSLNLKPGTHLPKMNGFSHIVLLGGPMNVYEEDRYPFLKEEDFFIKEAIQKGKTVLGICLGAQLIAKALGAKIYKSSIKEIGWYDVSLTEEGSKDPYFSFLPETFPVFQWHGDTFEIPKSGKLIATSSPISHQAFRYGEKVYGLQFHLEVTEDMIHEWVETNEEKPCTSEPLFFSKTEIMTETAIKIEHYTKRGMCFLKKFFNRRDNK
jgi:GMP synthase (glutamine-hydrolysing)